MQKLRTLGDPKHHRSAKIVSVLSPSNSLQRDSYSSKGLLEHTRPTMKKSNFSSPSFR